MSYNDVEVVRTIDVDQTVHELKKSLAILTGLAYSKMRLWLQDPTIEFGPEELKFKDKKLYSLCITDGVKFIVQPK